MEPRNMDGIRLWRISFWNKGEVACKGNRAQILTKMLNRVLTFLFSGATIKTTIESIETKCEDQKPVGWKEAGESCRWVRGKAGVLLNSFC